MDRRQFLKTLPLGSASAVAALSAWHRPPAFVPVSPEERTASQPPAPSAPEAEAANAPVELALDPLRDEGGLGRSADQQPGSVDPLQKIKNFDIHYPDDYILERARMPLLESVASRLERVQAYVGHGNFNLLSFDGLIQICHGARRVGQLTRQELDFLEELFFVDVNRYGFYGEKVITELTAEIPERDTKKIAGTGHYLLRGEPLAKYEQIRRDLGDTITLTSGVRGLVKQYQLFLSKAVTTAGNLSQASRSLAPPGHSYHAVGDFDVGKVGFGLSNFTETFATTDEFKKLIDLGYVAIRYTETNPFGVRHEPWHIKIA